MPQFQLTVVRGNEAAGLLEVSAPNRHEAQNQAQQQGYEVLAIRGGRGWAWHWPEKFPLLLFAQELLTLLRAGLNLVESLGGLAARPGAGQQTVINNLLADLREGKTFSTALARHPQAFPDLFCALVQASERTSDLPTALERYISYASQVEVLKKKLTNAALYPSLLVLVGGAVLLFLMTYVVPRFAGIYESLRGDLPWMSQALLWWGRALRDHAGWMLLAGVALSVAAAWAASRPAWRAAALQRVLRWRRIGRYVEGFRLARLYRALGMLLEGGIPLAEALQRVVALLPLLQQQQLTQARQAIQEGQPASVALQRYGLAPNLALQMLVVGERTGNLGGMMQRIAEFFEADTSRALEAFVRLFEPLLMTLIGLVIGTVVVLMYLPIFELAGSLQ